MILLLDQAADRERERRSVRDPRLLRGRRRGRGRELVEPVPDRDELARIVAGALEEDADRVRDRDDPARAAGECPVHVAERAEQVAVVVVARGDEGRARRGGRDRAVDVGMDEVRVQEVGPLGAHGQDHVPRQPRGHVEAAADAPVRHLERVEALVEAVRVRPGDVEAEDARVDAASAEGGEQGEEVVLRAAHAGELVQVEDLHRWRR
jgi:hypothetical protein